jgi:hypothetical protein
MATEPDQQALRDRARRHVERVRVLRRHAAGYGIGVISITAAWAAAGTSGTWIVWPLLVWTQILLAHALVTFLRRPVSEAEVERELEPLERDR